MTHKGNFMTLLQVGLLFTLPYAVIHGSWGEWVVALVMYAVYAGVGTVVTMHRLLAHRVFKTGKLFRWFGTFMGTVGSLVTPLEWVQQHLDHHRYVDTPKDPHSPAMLGWKAAFFCFHGQGTGSIAVMRLGKEPFMRFMHKWFYAILPAYIAALYLAGGAHAVLFVWAVPCLLSLWGQILIVFAHGEHGPKNTGWITGLLTFGENRHIRHHQNPGDIRQDGLARWFIGKVAHNEST
jgi:stearoyl-CoA desaturase (delta-9 desaturase)